MQLDTMLRLPAHLLRRAHQQSTALFAMELPDEDLTAIQYAALVTIADLGEPDSTAVSRVIGVDRATLGGVVERLEKKGLLSRTPSAADRRAKVLCLTGEGHALLSRVEPAVKRVQARLTQPLSSEEQKTLCDLLSRMVEHAEGEQARGA